MTKKHQVFTGLIHLGRQPASPLTLTDRTGTGARRSGPDEDEGPFDHEGTCCGCGRNSGATNRWTLCRSCATNPDAQAYPPDPD